MHCRGSCRCKHLTSPAAPRFPRPQVVIYATSAGTATFSITGKPSSLTALNSWHSVVTKGTSPDLTKYYNPSAAVPVAADGTFSVTLAAGDLYTLTTHTGGAKGTHPTPPPPSPFPPRWADTFDTCDVNQEAQYWTDQTGVWECVSDPTGSGRGVVMQQVVPAHPVAWRPDEQRPNSIIGDINWADTDITISVNMPAAGDSALIGARANPNCCSRVITGEDMMPGVWWQVEAESPSFYVYNAIQNVTKTNLALLSGTLPAAPAAGTWHTLRLVVTGTSAAGFYDGTQVFSALNVRGRTPPNGFAGIGTSNWGQYVLFDNVTIVAST